MSVGKGDLFSMLAVATAGVELAELVGPVASVVRAELVGLVELVGPVGPMVGCLGRQMAPRFARHLLAAQALKSVGLAAESASALCR